MVYVRPVHSMSRSVFTTALTLSWLSLPSCDPCMYSQILRSSPPFGISISPHVGTNPTDVYLTTFFECPWKMFSFLEIERVSVVAVLSLFEAVRPFRYTLHKYFLTLRTPLHAPIIP